MTALARIEKPAWHLNLRWSMEDMDFIASEAKAGVSAREIGETYGATAETIMALCQRNGIEVRK